MAKKSKRWVIKAGSQMVLSGGPLLIRAWMNQVAELKRKHQIEVIWVTSGAIASAVERTQFRPSNGKRRTLPEKQALSAIGQPMVMDLYNLALNSVGLRGAQVLLTGSDIEHVERRRNLQNTLNTLLAWQAVPILNENDAVSTEEIQFGDNDTLSAQIARMLRAERLVLLTDVDGLFTHDPKTDPRAELIRYRAKVTAQDLRMAGRKPAAGSRGTGGMYSKLLAAKTAGKDRIVTHFLRGDFAQGILLLAEGVGVGTQIGGKLKL